MVLANLGPSELICMRGSVCAIDSGDENLRQIRINLPVQNHTKQNPRA